MKIEINFTPPESCNICKWAKYKNHQFKHCCLIFDKQIPDYRTGGRLEECKERANEKTLKNRISNLNLYLVNNGAISPSEIYNLKGDRND